MLLNNINTIRNKCNGIMDGLAQKKEIFGSLKDDYIAVYKTLTEYEDFVKEEHNIHVYHTGDFDGMCHLLILFDADIIKYEITKGTYCIKSSNKECTDVELEILMVTTPLVRNDTFLQMALERYFLEDIKYNNIMANLYINRFNTNIPKWNKLSIVTDVAYAIALSFNICNDMPLGSIYGDLTALIKGFMKLGHEPHTLDITNMIIGIDLDAAYNIAITKVLQL